MKRDYSVLLKPYWYSSDIQSYFGFSKTYADQIKSAVESDCGVIPAHVDNERRAVCADDVIKYLGGKSRLEEMQIYNLLKEGDIVEQVDSNKTN